jgi:tRNA (guanine26-N2/guanine27-N2)-dimethyltransferase
MSAQIKEKRLSEGKAIFFASTGKISKELNVFYNPIMKLNRDISILLLNSVNKKDMQIADILAGSGIRSIRFKKELKKGKIKSIHANDINKKAFDIIKKNTKLNKIKIPIHNKDANQFLLESNGFDYIDIDPFGSPNPFLNSAIVRLSRNGILAVTSTDTSALAGSHELACKRKYWAKPLKNELMHEIGTRILIRKIQLIGAQFEKALIPIFTHASDHYYRVYFVCKKSKQEIDKLQKQH